MPLQDLTPPPTAPQRTNDSETFNDRADAFVSWFSTFVSEMSALTAELEAAAALLAVAPAYSDPTLTTIADSGLTPAADRGIYFTGAATAALFTLSSFGRTLAALADAAAARTALGLAIGTNVQAYSANLDEYAAVNPTAAGLALLDDADAAAQRTTLGLGSLATANTVNDGNWSGADLAIANGGTGASSAAAALAALGGIGITAEDLAADGYIELSNGLHLIWGTFSATGNASTTFNYTTANASISLSSFSVAVVSGGPTSGGDNMPHVTSATTTGFTVYNAYSSTVTTHFFAVGY